MTSNTINLIVAYDDARHTLAHCHLPAGAAEGIHARIARIVAELGFEPTNEQDAWRTVCTRDAGGDNDHMRHVYTFQGKAWAVLRLPVETHWFCSSPSELSAFFNLDEAHDQYSYWSPRDDVDVREFFWPTVSVPAGADHV